MKNKLLKILCLVAVFLVFVPLLVGCQSVNQENTYLDTGVLDNANFEYDAEKDQTKVRWTTTLTNDTIYDFESFSVKFELYSGNTLKGTKTCSYNCRVEHGQSYAGNFNFYCDGEINSIEFVSWSADHVSFWKTYWIWILVTSIIAGVAALIYIICVFVKELELCDVFDNIGEFFEEYGWVAFILFFSGVGITILGIALSYWVPILIILGGLIAFVLLSLLGHFIRWLCEELSNHIWPWECHIWPWEWKYLEQKNNSPKTRKKINKTLQKRNAEENEFESYTLAELKDYCRENGITGYSGLSKAELLDLINDNSKTSKTKRSKSRKITFDDIAGLENAKQAFKEKVVLAFEHKALYEKYGKKVGGGILLYGLPGTGKTMFAEAASNETDSLFIPIKCSDIKSKWYGESEANIKKIFNKARNAGKAIIFFDEFEAIGAKRTDNADNGNNDLVPEILAEMQGVNQKSNAVIVVIASTNKPWAIDSAFLRPGRFDEKIYIPLPDMQAREKLCELKLKNVPTQDLDYHQMAELTNGFNGADITEFCEKLKMYAIRESLASGKEHIINMEDVMKVSATVKSSVLEEDIENLKAFEDKF